MIYELDVVENIYDYISEYYDEIITYIGINNYLKKGILELNLYNFILDASSMNILSSLIDQYEHGLIAHHARELEINNDYIDISFFLKKAKIVFRNVEYINFTFSNNEKNYSYEYKNENKYSKIIYNSIIGKSIEFDNVDIFIHIKYENATIILEEQDINLYTLNLRKFFSLEDVHNINICEQRLVQLKNKEFNNQNIEKILFL